MLKVRKAVPKDFERIMQIYEYARGFMIRSGNPRQWGRGYPSPELVQTDIREGYCMAVYDEDGVHGAFALISGEDPTYARIEGGAWLNSGPYVTIHRIAGDGKTHGIFKCAADFCKSFAQNIRIDTHADNKIMQRRIESNGFVKCGTIYIADGSPRIAYQWTSGNDEAG
ncbi:MAG: N-acetyltransferase [Clostridia bacterium]|nr:N-acetyltransferase [Clostridia bacterium]MBP5238068.1 N-acetyltransferase [Clostridia bacterium]MBP5658224.1 N-acetyltransferase [Clostridia bacterium]MBP5755376.1 N-acetyltransferase [Clostridia bacterium]MBQ6183862.1 N-acetyltransferase [Clostridia bacterium]